MRNFRFLLRERRGKGRSGGGRKPCGFACRQFFQLCMFLVEPEEEKEERGRRGRIERGVLRRQGGVF